MKKRLLFLVPAVAMLLAGCGKNGGDPTSTSGVTPTTEQPSTSGVEPTSQSGTPTEPGPDSSSSVEPAPDVEPAEIYLSPSNRANLIVGDTMQFTAEVRNQAHSAEGVDQRVTWEIAAADEGKYTCVNGLVTALAPAEDLTLTVKSVAKDSVTKDITINIAAPDANLPAETSDGFALFTSANMADIENGDEVYFVGIHGEDIYDAKAQSGNFIPAEKVSVSENKLVPSANAARYTIILNSDETVSFKIGDKLLYTPCDGNNLKAADPNAASTPITDKNSHFEFTVDAKGYINANSKSDGDVQKFVRFNYNSGSSERFSCYKEGSSISQKISMYFKTPQRAEGIRVKTAPTNTKYVVGETFSPAGVELEKYYNYGDPTPVTEYDYDLKSALAVENTKVTFSADGFQCEQAIEVHEKVLSLLEVTKQPTKLTYNIGESFAPDGMVVKATFNKDQEGFERIDADFKGYTSSPASFTAAGDQNVTLSVAGSEVTTTVAVHVNSIVLESIEITTNPSDMSYFVGQSLDPTGMVVTGHYSDSSSAVIPNGSLTFDPATFTEAGASVSVEVYSGSIHTTLSGVEVIAVVETEIAITHEPTKLLYEVGDTLDLTGLVVTVTKNYGDSLVWTYDSEDPDCLDGLTLSVAEDYVFTQDDATIGAKQIIVTRDGLDPVGFNVTVEEINTIRVAMKAGEALADNTKSEDEYTFTGVVTGFQGKSFFVQDRGYAMYCYWSSTKSGLAVGKNVTVVSKLKNFKGLVEAVDFTASNITINGDDSVPSAIDIETVTDLNGVNQSMLVDYVELEIISPLTTWSSSNTVNSTVKLGGETVSISLNKGAFEEANNDVIKVLTAGQKFGIENGVVGMFNSKQVAVTNQSVFTAHYDPVESVAVKLSGEDITHSTVNKTLGADAFTVTAEIAPSTANQAVTWNSSKEEVATVDSNGLVTLVGEGNTIIQAISIQDDTKDAFFTLSVSRPALTAFKVVVEGSEAAQTISDGDSLSFDVVAIPNEAVVGEYTLETGSASNVTPTINNHSITFDLIDDSQNGTISVWAVRENEPLTSQNVIDVTINKAGVVTLTGLTITTPATTTSFTKGAEFSAAGLVLTAEYSDGNDETGIAYNDARLAYSGYDMSTTGDQTVTVTFTDSESRTISTTYAIKVQLGVIKLENLGSSLTSTSNTVMETMDVTATDTSDIYTLNYLQCKKQGSSALLAKSTGAFIANHTPISGKIESITVYINSGASGKTTYYCCFSTTECTEAYEDGSAAVNITGGNNHTYQNTTAVSAHYFCISLGNANNGQVLSVDINYSL